MIHRVLALRLRHQGAPGVAGTFMAVLWAAGCASAPPAPLVAPAVPLEQVIAHGQLAEQVGLPHLRLLPVS